MSKKRKNDDGWGGYKTEFIAMFLAGFWFNALLQSLAKLLGATKCQ
jgi:hypothetical protein